MVQMDRRRFMSRAMTTAAAGLAVSGFWPPATDAQAVSGILSLFMSANPILGVVDLFETGYSFVSHMNDPKISDIATQIDKVARDLKNNFEDLKVQTRQIVRAALEWNDLRQDTVEFAALSYSLNIAMSRSDSTEVINLSGAIDKTTHRLGSYGLAGSLAYINAIAMQNAMHSVLGSAPKVILAVNKPHDERIGNIIYDGKNDYSLEHAIQVTRTEVSSSPYYKNYQFLKDSIGNWYNVGMVTRYYENQGIFSVCDLSYVYEGFQRSEPVIAYRSYGPEKFSSNLNNFYNGRIVKATYTPFGGNEAFPIIVKPNNSLVFPEQWPSGQALIDRINRIADGYRKVYSPGYGSEINSRTDLKVNMTPEQAAFREYLINTGLKSVKRIVAVAQAAI